MEESQQSVEQFIPLSCRLWEQKKCRKRKADQIIHSKQQNIGTNFILLQTNAFTPR